MLVSKTNQWDFSHSCGARNFWDAVALVNELSWLSGILSWLEEKEAGWCICIFHNFCAILLHMKGSSKPAASNLFASLSLIPRFECVETLCHANAEHALTVLVSHISNDLLGDIVRASIHDRDNSAD